MNLVRGTLAVVDGDVGDHSATVAVRGVLEARVIGVQLGPKGQDAARVAVQFADPRREPRNCTRKNKAMLE